MKIIRTFFKVLLLPFMLILSIIIAVSTFIIERCAGILSLLSSIIFIASLVGYSQYLFGWPFGVKGSMYSLQTSVFGTVFAFLLSPYGLPLFGLWLVSKINDFNRVIKSI